MPLTIQDYLNPAADAMADKRGCVMSIMRDTTSVLSKLAALFHEWSTLYLLRFLLFGLAFGVLCALLVSWVLPCH